MLRPKIVKIEPKPQPEESLLDRIVKLEEACEAFLDERAAADGKQAPGVPVALVKHMHILRGNMNVIAAAKILLEKDRG